MQTLNPNLRIPIKSWCPSIEQGALNQAINLTKLPFVYGHVALMPDCHEGFGMPIGGVIACKDFIIPNAVGVDIGCGMRAVKTDVKASGLDRNSIRTILNQIRGTVPMGFEHHKSDRNWQGFDKAPDLEIIAQETKSAKRQLGTLGGGNHFIELQKDEDDDLWFMIHSGSRNFGLKIANYYHNKALLYCQKHNLDLPDKDLAYLPMNSQDGTDYKTAMDFACAFALENRRQMKESCEMIVQMNTHCTFTKEINIHHNFASLEKHFGRSLIVHRKGATQATLGKEGIIPGSMGTASYIVIGKGNKDSFESCSHGAGRCMGRNQANKTLTLEQVKQSLNGIVMDTWQKDRKGKIDLSEAPQAYKDIDEVMGNQKDLVEIAYRLTPLGVAKG